MILLAKSIDGVYDSDPKDNPAAKKYDDDFHSRRSSTRSLAVVDMTASIHVHGAEDADGSYSDLNGENSIVNTVSGTFNGTSSERIRQIKEDNKMDKEKSQVYEREDERRSFNNLLQ